MHKQYGRKFANSADKNFHFCQIKLLNYEIKLNFDTFFEILTSKAFDRCIKHWIPTLLRKWLSLLWSWKCDIFKILRHNPIEWDKLNMIYKAYLLYYNCQASNTNLVSNSSIQLLPFWPSVTWISGVQSLGIDVKFVHEVKSLSLALYQTSDFTFWERKAGFKTKM